MSNISLSVIIPAFNEESRLGSTLDNLLVYLSSRGLPFEILIIDDGSSDGTFAIATQQARDNSSNRLRVFRNEGNRGKGYSVRRGIQHAEGAYALMTDADLSCPIQEITKLEKQVQEESFDIAFGSRDIAGSQVEVHQHWARESSGKIFNHLVHSLTGLPYQDTQCGFKYFNLTVCRELFDMQTIQGFGFDVEILYIARKWGLKAKEVPVVWRHADGSKLHFVPDALEMFLDLLRIRRNDRRGRYEKSNS